MSGKKPANGRNQGLRGSCMTFPGAEYDDDEREFIAAVDRYKTRTGRQFPTLSELLGILKQLGYAKREGK